MGVAIARGLIGGLGVLLLLGGIVVAVAAGPGGDLFAVLFLVVPGAILVIAALVERLRYRSLAADRQGDDHGPGGGEPSLPEARFRPTDEQFVDPTTGIRMRVFLDPRTGERRYVADG
jgi:hypothetical protein